MMMRRRPIRALPVLPAVAALALLSALPVSALDAAAATDGAGHFPFEELGLFSGEKVNVDVNLQGAMIRFAAAVLVREEPELAEMIRGIERIRAQVIEEDLEQPSEIRGRMGEAVGWLEKRGWNRAFKFSEEDEEVHVFVREGDGILLGIAVLAIEDGNATAVNIVGRIDPEQFGRFMARQEFSEVTGFLGD